MKTTLLSLLVLLAVLPGRGEKLWLSHLGIEGGLTNNKINTLTRNRDGFVWLGTIAGLVRHDGYDYRIYYVKGKNGSPEGENDVDIIVEDCEGRLWIRSHDLWYYYDPMTDRIEHSADSLLSSMGVKGSPRHIYADKGRGLWINTDSGDIFNIPAGSDKAAVVKSGRFPSLKDKKITAFADSPGGITAVTDRGELYGISPSAMEVTGYDNHISSSTSPDDKMVYSALFDRDGLGWIYNTERLWLFDSASQTWISERLPSQGHDMVVKDILQDSQGRLWVARDHHGLEKVDKSLGHISFTKSGNEGGLPPHSTVTDLYEDTYGTLWIGTYKHWAFFADKSARKFTLDSLPDSNTLLPRTDGTVWVGTDADGLLLWQPSDDTYQTFRDPAEGGEPKAITSLYETNDGTLYIGSFSRGLRSFRDRRYNRVVTGSLLDDSYIWSIIPGVDGSLWAGTLTNGVFNYNPSTGAVSSYSTKTHDMPSDCVISLTLATDGTLYIATAYGVAFLQPGNSDVSVLDGIPPLTVNDILVDSHGLLWVASQQGVKVYNPHNGKIHNADYETAPGAKYATGLKQDKPGCIWASEGGKLVSFEVAYDPVTGDITTSPRVYDSSDGLQNADFNQRSFAILPSGELLLCGPYGINRLNPKEIILNDAAPKVMFSTLSIGNDDIEVGEKVDGRVILPVSLNRGATVNLGPHTNGFTIAFATDNYILPEKTVFHYRLEGFDKEWLTTPRGSNLATYTNLTPGRYRLLVRAVNNDGFASEEAATLDIVVHPPFYLSVWAYMLYAILIAGAIGGTVVLIRRRERRRFNERRRLDAAKKEEELNQLKFKFFTSVSHDLRTPLTLILSPLETMLKEAVDDKQKRRLALMRKNAGHLLDMVNQLLDFRKSEMAGLKLRLSDGDMNTFLTGVCRSFTALSSSRDITLEYHSDIRSLPMRFDENKMYKVMMNLLGNAHKFTPDGGRIDIYLNLSDDGKEAVIRVADTGCGISDDDKARIFERFYQGESTKANPSATGYGIGLSLVNDYVTLHEGRISVSDNTPAGAVFEIAIPIIPVAPPVAAPPATTGDRPAEGKEEKPLVLVIDDNQDMLQFLKEGLSKDFRVATAADGTEALRLLASVKPSIIVTDMMMPGMDGTELCRNIKEDKKLSSIPIIVLSAKTDEQAKVEMLTIGADDYITKPFSTELLTLRMKRLVSLTALTSGRHLINPEPGNIDITPLDEKMVEKATRYVVNNMKRTDLSVEELSSHLGMSRVHLYKKLKAVTGRTPIEFIRIIRLKRSAQLLRESQLNVSEVAYQVGFNSPKYFTRYFKEEFGILPSEYKDLKEQTTFRPL